MTPTTFKIWDETNSKAPKLVKREAYITIGGKNGHISISPYAAEILKLQKASRLIFLEGQGDTPTFFLSKSIQSGVGIKVNSFDKRKAVYYSITAHLLAARFREICHNDGHFRIRMSTVPETLPKGGGLPAAAFRLYVNESIFKTV